MPNKYSPNQPGSGAKKDPESGLPLEPTTETPTVTKKDPNTVVSEDNGMEPLNNKGLLNLTASIEYFYNAEADAYYSRTDEFGSTSSYILVPIGSNLDKRLRKEHPRGINEYYDDFNPVLETSSTIKSTFGGAGDQAPGAAGSVRFPHDMLIGAGDDFVMFDFYDYKPPFQDKVSPDGKVINQTLQQ